MRFAVLAVLLLSAAPAWGVEAIAYRGTLGGYGIVVELAAPVDGALAGRYSYLAKGGDIPLDGMGRLGTPVTMSEEAPCTPTTCIQDENGTLTDAPVGAIWTLTPSADGKTMTGTWQAMGKAGKTLDIALTKIGQRTLPDDGDVTPYTLYDSAVRLMYGDDFTAVTDPYDLAKMDVALTEGPIETLDGSRFRAVTDPRSKFAFPRLVSLADGSSPDAANAALAARHVLLNLYAFDCLAQVYGGFGGGPDTGGGAAGTLGDFDSEQVTLTYLSPTVLNWIESGSTYCTGAHPNNHSDSYLVDVRTGKPFALALVFKDWTATSRVGASDAPIDQAAAIANPDDYYWQAGQPLIDYAIAHRTPSDDAEYEAECGIDELIASNLKLRFAPGDRVVFTLEALPHAIFACGEDLLTVKLADIPELLAPTAAAVFPALAAK